jgi:cellulose synthase/poly-beta-1,6-N-acetylglucosamine synthase-like glycosyltransferase
MLIVQLAIGFVLSVPSLVFVVECLAGIGKRSVEMPLGTAPPFVVLVPAHNEAAGVGGTIDAVKDQLRACDRLLVVADNCTDATAAVARARGVEVLERSDEANRGKGYALAAGRSALTCAPPTVVIVLDADCLPEPGALPLLAAAANGGSVVQGLYLMSGGGVGNAKSGISIFAFIIKNWVRQRGLKTLGGPALLQGSGMAFPWSVFAQAPLASGDIVEDLELGLTLALDGVPIRFQESAVFLSQASSGKALVSQRVRWEHGSLGVARRYVPKLALAVLKLRFGLLPLLLDILVPPLALLVLFMIAVTLAATAFGIIGGGFGVAAWMFVQLAILALTVIAVWSRFGRESLPLSDLMRVPAYLFWKLPIYARLFGHRERRWIRTERE